MKSMADLEKDYKPFFEKKGQLILVILILILVSIILYVALIVFIGIPLSKGTGWPDQSTSTNTRLNK